MPDHMVVAFTDIRTAPAAPSTAVLVINSYSGPVLCPFFGRCEGVLLFDRTGKAIEFHERDRSNTRPLCDLIIELKPDRLVCGFIGDAEKQKLQEAGLDVRVGSCSCSIDALVADFENLPRA